MLAVMMVVRMVVKSAGMKVLMTAALWDLRKVAP